MRLFQIVFKDIIRRKRRTMYAALGVIIGTMAFVGVQTVAHAAQDRLFDQLEKYGPNLTITPSVVSMDTSLGNFNLGSLTIGENYIPETAVPLIQQIADERIREEIEIEASGPVATVAPKLYSDAEINGVNVVVVGVQPDTEASVRTWWRIKEGQYFSEETEAIVGSVAAELFSLKPGSILNLNEQKLAVTAVLEENGSADDYQIFIPLETSQRVFEKEGLVSMIDVRALCNGCPVEYIADSINNNITGVRAVSVKQVAVAEMGIMSRINNFMLTLAVISLVIGLFAVINTMMTSVHARIKDIGIMRAVGASRRQIIRAFTFEAAIIGVIGGIAGYVAGTLLAYIIGPVIFDGIQVRLVPLYLPIAFGISMVITVIATIYPAFQATRIKVSDSFRSL